MTQPRKHRRHVRIVTCDKGKVELTQQQLDYILSVADGGIHPQMGSTADLVKKKINTATGWKTAAGAPIFPIQLFCRFAATYGLVPWGTGWVE